MVQNIEVPGQGADELERELKLHEAAEASYAVAGELAKLMVAETSKEARGA